MTNTDLTPLTSVSGPLAAWRTLYTAALAVIGLLLLLCLVRAVIGPRMADRIIAVNMMGTLVTIVIIVLVFLLGEGWLTDVALVYAMLSFLAVVLLTRLFMSAYHRKHRRKDREEERDDG